MIQKLPVLIGLLVGILIFSSGVYSKSNTQIEPNEPDSLVQKITKNTKKEEISFDKSQQQKAKPTYIYLPSINSDGSIQEIGVNKDNEMDAPTDIKNAGWFRESVIPGEKGLSIINGHLDGKIGNGIFKSLSKLKTGDKFEIEFDDSTIKKFEVMKVITVNTDEATSALFSQDPTIASQLNLITCAGNFNASSLDYSKRVIVTSKFIED